MLFKEHKTIGQLPANRGAYYYIELEKAFVESLPRKKSTRLICTINDDVILRCGLNHMGDGNFFIIISKASMKTLNAYPGEKVEIQIEEDPNPLGVEIPAVLDVIFNEFPDAKIVFDDLTDGKKRSLIYSVIKIKNVDKQIEKIMRFFKLN